jgi:hypothetical protein
MIPIGPVPLRRLGANGTPPDECSDSRWARSRARYQAGFAAPDSHHPAVLTSGSRFHRQSVAYAYRVPVNVDVVREHTRHQLNHTPVRGRCR